MSNTDYTYEQLKQFAINATAVAGDMLTSPAPDALAVASLTLQGAQVFATLALAQAEIEGNEKFLERTAARATVRPIRPSVN